jgi:hypothetical protein
MRTSPIVAMSAAASAILAALPVPAALAQGSHPMFVAHVTVENRSPVPQAVAGTNVPPFELSPYRQAVLAMNAAPLPSASGSRIPVRFYFSIGQAPGPQCRGTIDMTVIVRGTSANENEATKCVGHSLGTGGGSCNIAMNARNSVCEGGLAFVAP